MYDFNDDQKPAWVGAGKAASARDNEAVGTPVAAPGSRKAPRIDTEGQKNSVNAAAAAAGAASDTASSASEHRLQYRLGASCTASGTEGGAPDAADPTAAASVAAGSDGAAVAAATAPRRLQLTHTMSHRIHRARRTNIFHDVVKKHVQNQRPG